MLALIAQATSSFATLHCVTSILAFLFGSCWLFISFAKDITNDLSPLNARKKLNQRNGDLKKRFIDITQYHADIKQLSAIGNIDLSVKIKLNLLTNIHVSTALLPSSMQYMNLSFWVSFHGQF